MSYIDYLEIAGYTGLAAWTAILCWPAFSGFISVFFLRKKPRVSDQETDFAFLITAYKDAMISAPLVRSLLNQKYTNFRIYLIADSCPSFDFPENDNRLTIIKPEEPLNSKVKSIITGMDAFTRPHEAVVIFDPDNLAHPSFSKELNRYFQDGFKAVQGRRTAKNLDTAHACLDAAGEYYYNFIQRYVSFRLGSSAPIAGSGMGIKTEIFQDFLNSPEIRSHLEEVIVAEDKQLQIDLVSAGHVIAYARDAVVYDEKVLSGPQVERQRTRWINSWFLFFKKAISLLFKGIRNLDRNQIIFAANIAMPPLFMQVGIAGILALIGLIFWMPAFWFMFVGLGIFTLYFLIVLRLCDVQPEIWRALFRVPVFMVNQLLATLKLKRSNKDFMVTEHSRMLEIDEVMRKWGHYS